MDCAQLDTSVPRQLTERRQWVNWDYESRTKNGKATKVPKQTNGLRAKSNDADTWSSFQEVLDNSSKHDGRIAFMFSEQDPFCGIDLDNCFDDAGELRPWAKPLVDALVPVSYGEVSPSGTGIKFTTIGKKPDGAKSVRSFADDKQQVECYDNRRFWAITGNALEGAYEPRDGQAVVDRICAEHFSSKPSEPHNGQSRNGHAKKPNAAAGWFEKRANAYLAKIPTPPEGNRDNTIFQVAGSLLAMSDNGYHPSAGEVFDVLFPWVTSFVDESPEYVRAKINNASKNGTPRDDKPSSADATRVRFTKNHRRDDGESFAWISNDQLQNDSELATLFVSRFNDRFRYVPAWGKFIIWDGKRFKVDPDQTHALRIVRIFAKSLWDDLAEFVKETHPDEDEIRTAHREIRRINNIRGLEAVLKCARADRRVIVEVDQINADPFLLNLQNGTLELSTGDFREHRQSDLITQVANVSYDASATCPEWKQTVKLITGNDDDLAIYLQQLFGYSMSGDTGEAILPIAYGDGRNGKSTIWNTLVELLGDYATVASESLLLGKTNEHASNIAALYGKRFVVIAEPDQEQPLREARMKELTGEKFITARRMREDWWTFQRTHTFFVACNHLPKIKGTDKGVWRRIKQIPFTQDLGKIEGLTIRKSFNEWLVANEGAGILNWLIDGLALYFSMGNKFKQPQAVTDATTSYQMSEDPLQEFIDEYCDIGTTFEVTAKRIYQHYKDNGGTMTSTMFGRELSRRFPKSKATSGPNRNRSIYSGISIRS
ncbi:MAG: hypothetical protein F9B45_28605 [Phycisphaera sp. RhM]|nr:hypothetical protein [Phycisphaera sp. RhM]